MSKPIHPVDIDFLLNASKIRLGIVPADSVKLDPMSADVFAGFNDDLIGFIQVPSEKDGRLYKHCELSRISFNAKDGLFYVPVFVFEYKDAVFDSEIFCNKSFEGLDWVVLYHGHDNCSYGRRFKSKFDAMNFTQKGCLNGFQNLIGKLDFYNS